jgi:hypothetical protein
MGSMADNNTPLRLFQFDTARTNCQAFYKLFSQHPQLGWGRFYHGFSSPALYGPERIQQRLRHSDAAEQAQIDWGTKFPSENWKTYDWANQDLLEKIEATEKDGKIFFGKEHCPCVLKQDLIIDSIRGDPFAKPAAVTSNPTIIPDDVLDTFTPIFVIRHPILMVDSLYRCQLLVMGQLPTDEDFEAFGTLRFCRILFEYYKSKGTTPALVEAVDFIYKTKATMDKLCKTIGIDPEGIKDTWDPLPEEYMPDHHVAIAFTGDMMRSSGLERRNKEVRPRHSGNGFTVSKLLT